MSYSIQEKLIRVNPKTRPGRKIDVKGVVIHWTANEANGADNLAHFNYFNKGTVYASAHYFVDSKGILRIIPENEMAYHVGARSYKTSKYGSYPNASMIGVEMCVNSDGNFAETYKRSVWVVADILKRHKLTINELERHFDITGKSCPKMFTEDAYAKKYMGMTAAQAHEKFRKDVANVLNPPKPAPQPVGSYTGTIEVLVSALNVRKDANFSAPVVKVINKGEKYKVYGEKNGLYNLGGSQWTSSNSKYVKFTPAPKPKPNPKPTVGTYVVKQGDTLWGIARDHGITVTKLKSLNGLKTNVINPGDVLKVAKVHIVASGDTLWGISRKYNLSVTELKKLNGLTTSTINPGDVLKVG